MHRIGNKAVQCLMQPACHAVSSTISPHSHLLDNTESLLCSVFDYCEARYALMHGKETTLCLNVSALHTLHSQGQIKAPTCSTLSMML